MRIKKKDKSKKHNNNNDLIIDAIILKRINRSRTNDQLNMHYW